MKGDMGVARGPGTAILLLLPPVSCFRLPPSACRLPPSDFCLLP